MKTKLITLILLFVYLSFSAQDNCGTPTPSTVFNPTIPSSSTSKTVPGPFCINMRFNIVRRTNGTGGFDPANINELVDRINRDFLPNGISVQSIGVSFINNDALFDADGDAEHNTLFNTNNAENAINCYLVNSASLGGRALAGRAQSIVSRNFLVTNDRARTSTSSHELGHCLNLLHTHETAFGVEAINGSNCSSAGDRVCDTPA
ncbi:MAG: hypothetical protein WBG48_14430 [Pricia sp.]